MIEKKTKKADLEPRRGIFIQIGAVVALTVLLFAFEMRQYDRVFIDLGTADLMEDLEETVLQTQQNEPPPPPPEQQQTTILEIVEDDIEVDDDLTFDAEADVNTEMEEFIPIAEEEEESGEAEIFMVVEEQPSFPGGEEARLKFLSENVAYPQMARESGIQGRVYVTFVVEPDGRITNVQVLRDIGGGCGSEAVRVVKMMPRWKPGKQRGKSVRVQFNMPVNFVLQSN